MSSDDIEIEFRQGRAKAEFGAELDDSGVLSLEITQKLKGPVPNYVILRRDAVQLSERAG